MMCVNRGSVSVLPNTPKPSAVDVCLRTIMLANEQCAALGELLAPWNKEKRQDKQQNTTTSSTGRIWRKNRSTSANCTENSGQGCQTLNSDEQMSLLQFLAINALELTVPASSILLSNQKIFDQSYSEAFSTSQIGSPAHRSSQTQAKFAQNTQQWFQLSGHPDSLAPAGPGTVWKRRGAPDGDTERRVYEQLSSDPLLKDVVPRYYREVRYQGEEFIELQNLLHGFQDPYVVDIKMGTRTFLESEVKNATARNDLYQKMISIDPLAPTAAEHAQKAVTKLKYMQFREKQSSTNSQGFRIEAMKIRGADPVNDLKTVKSRSQVSKFMTTFLSGQTTVREKLLNRLHDIRNRFESSDFFKTREIIGSSIFMIYDDHKSGVWIIDFAKTREVPSGISLDHRRPWEQGNYEEGFLFGLDQLISIIEEIKPPSIHHEDKLSNSLKTVPVKV